jgi:flagella basal body P-ring formation protein FlgA
MIRRTAALAALAAAALLPAPAGAAPTLRPAVTVSGSVLHVGDLFDDAGPAAAESVAPAPALGARVVANGQWLAAVARAHGLAWTPRPGEDQAVIERAARVVGADTIAERLLAEVAKRGAVDNAEIELDNPGLRLVVPAEAADAVAVEGISFDERSGRIAAVVAAAAGDPHAERQRVTGRLVRFLEVPVLNRPLAPGETISSGDVERLKLRRDRLAADVVTDAAELVGKTPRHALRAQQPLRQGEVQAPVVVHKGELVTLLLETPVLRLTAQGKALEDGAMGASVRVANAKSSRVVDAVVAGSGVAHVAAAQGDR